MVQILKKKNDVKRLVFKKSNRDRDRHSEQYKLLWNKAKKMKSGQKKMLLLKVMKSYFWKKPTLSILQNCMQRKDYLKTLMLLEQTHISHIQQLQQSNKDEDNASGQTLFSGF